MIDKYEVVPKNKDKIPQKCSVIKNKSDKIRKPANVLFTGFSGGAGGIRTHVAVTPNGFQVIWGEVKGPNLLRFKAIYYPKYTLLMHLSQYV